MAILFDLTWSLPVCAQTCMLIFPPSMNMNPMGVGLTQHLILPELSSERPYLQIQLHYEVMGKF